MFKNTRAETKVKSNGAVDSSSEINDKIGVKINMPPGTIKALIYCLVAIVVVGAIVLVGFIHDWSTSYYDTEEYQRRVNSTKDRILEGKEHFAEYSDTVIINAMHEVEESDSSNGSAESENDNSTEPYADYQNAWDAQQMEEAMNSLAEEAMREEAQERAMEDAMNSMDPFH